MIESRHRVYLGTGSNLGDRLRNLELARQHIAVRIGPIVLASQVYETAAWGIADQPDFLNQALLASTELAPESILDEILSAERQMGRLRNGKWGPRLIDIDLLFYDDCIIHTDRLTVPHPFLSERRFVLAPLNEIAPDLRHPVLGLSVAELLAALKDSLIVAPYQANTNRE